MAQSLAQFALAARRAGDALPKNSRRGVEAAALIGKRSVQAELVRAGVSGGKLRNVGLRGSKVGVRYDKVVGENNPSATLRATGRGFQLIERDTKAHRITPRTRGRRALRNAAARGERSTNRRAVVVPGVGPRRSVNHPGTKGKHPFEKGVDRARPAMRRAISEAMLSTLRG